MSRTGTTAATTGTGARSRPSPVRRQPGSEAPPAAHGRLDMADGGFGRRLREAVRSPLLLLMVAMAVLAVMVNRGRLGLDLSGGRLLPPSSLGDTWASYLAGWHPVGGGSAAPAPTALAVLGVLGLPVGAPATAVSLLLLAAMPLAALSAYVATRSLPVSRLSRALAAAAYAVLPPAIAGVAQGRLDVVLVYLLLPLVLAGTVVVLRGGTPGRVGGLLSVAAATALGLAVISAFAPLLHLLVLALVLVGFVLVPAPKGSTLRRALGLFAIVLLPLGMLVPWPAVVVQRPAVLLHGVGAVVPEQAPSWLQLLALDPGGAGATPWVGLLVVVAALLALVLRPSAAMLGGLGLVVLGGGVAVALTMFPVRPLAGGDVRPGFTGGVLLFAACGLLWIILLAARTDRTPRKLVVPGGGAVSRVLLVFPWLGVGALAVTAVLVGASGPLGKGTAAGQPVLAPALADELSRDSTSVLVVGDKGEPVRLTRSRTPRFGDDDIAPLRATGFRLDRVADALREAKPGETEAAIANVAATGVEFVVLPTPEQGERALAASGALARSAPPTSDGRPVLRVVRPVPGAELLGPALAE
ncbi:MAG TPA: glycosyltransferase, partial [Pseudonocardiaceae bacterium]|nr:glycosyltransferase [Pseudonocardiaceae bacterium]